MKSSEGQLRLRGLAREDDIKSLRGRFQNELLKLIHSEDAVMRTAAAYNINICEENEEEVSQELLKQLSIEKCLYTKIAICECLEKGGRITAEHMTEYLGKIGGNQHKEILESVSKKRSFPLPRDIIARSLGKMSAEVFPVLLQVLCGTDIEKISEVLDAVGFMVFYNPMLCNKENAEEVYAVMKKYKDNLLIKWKCIICLSAFPFNKTEDILEKYVDKDNILGREAKRSLSILKR